MDLSRSELHGLILLVWIGLLIPFLLVVASLYRRTASNPRKSSDDTYSKFWVWWSAGFVCTLFGPAAGADLIVIAIGLADYVAITLITLFTLRKKSSAPNHRLAKEQHESNSELPNLTAQQILDITTEYEEIAQDEGATGRPSDYAKSLTYIPPALDFPGRWPEVPLCGCCSVPFAIDPRKSGLWVAHGAGPKQAGKLVPLCSVCISYLNKQHAILGQGSQFRLPSNYDSVGQQLIAKLPFDDLKRLAVCRVALLRKQWADHRG